MRTVTKVKPKLKDISLVSRRRDRNSASRDITASEVAVMKLLDRRFPTNEKKAELVGAENVSTLNRVLEKFYSAGETLKNRGFNVPWLASPQKPNTTLASLESQTEEVVDGVPQDDKNRVAGSNRGF